jgi:hypothetical protein
MAIVKLSAIVSATENFNPQRKMFLAIAVAEAGAGKR